MNRVTVTFADGTIQSATVRYYRGHANNQMSDGELEEKFREQAEPVLTTADGDALVKAVWELDQAGTPEGLFAWTAKTSKKETAVAG